MEVTNLFMHFVIFINCFQVNSGLDIQTEYSNGDLYNMIQTMNQSITNLENENVKLKQQHALANTAKPIAFYARLMHDITTIGDNQAIEYNGVVTNIGHGYDSRHGHFIAPVNGIYIFAVTAMGEPNEALHLNIVKNGAVVGYVRSALSSEYETGSAVITLSLVAGDMVWVRYGSSYGSASRKIHGSGFNTFAGALITAL